MAVVFKHFDRADAGLVDRFANHGIATIHEAQGRKGLLAPNIRPIYKGAHIAGTALTVSLPPADNWMIHVAAEVARPGDIMVVAPTSYSDAGYFGDLLGTVLHARGVRGLVIDGGCRDIADLERMGFPVWSNAVSAQGTVKETLGDVNVPIVCAGQRVCPGDVIVADDDGVVVVAREEADEMLEKSRARDEKEAAARERYANGELGLDVNNMRPRLAEKGLRYADED